MYDIITIVLLLIVIIIQVFVLLKKGATSPDTELVLRLAESEKRQRDELDRTRVQVETLLREAAATQQRDLREQAVESLRSAGEGRFALQRDLTESLTAGRRSQDERLDRLDATLGAFSKNLTAESTGQKAVVADLVVKLEKGQAEFTTQTLKLLKDEVGKLNESLVASLSGLREGVTGKLQERLDRVDQLLGDFQTRLQQGMAEQQVRLTAMQAAFDATQKQGVADMIAILTKQLETMRSSNEAKLELIRGTVDEKLQTTLEKRLGESFKLVSAQLESVQKGLGEMQTLATGVGDLKRVLTNVKSRGSWGETQLSMLLEQILHPTQYKLNVAVVPNSNERVEFAICLPGSDDSGAPVYLPIDAKFPTEDYERLQTAADTADKPALDAARKALRMRLVGEAQKIQVKYVSPPHTTDFALLYLPSEGLYAEALRIEGLLDELQRVNRVILVGPSTLYAILNSLQMGFKTLAIQKRSSEVWSILSAVKTDFGRFGESLGAVAKKLQEATNKVADAQKASGRVTRSLRDVEEMEATSAAGIFTQLDSTAEDEEEAGGEGAESTRPARKRGALE